MKRWTLWALAPWAVEKLALASAAESSGQIVFQQDSWQTLLRGTALLLQARWREAAGLLVASGALVLAWWLSGKIKKEQKETWK